jgi:hypothetical protein
MCRILAAVGMAVATPFQTRFGAIALRPAAVLIVTGLLTACADAPRTPVAGPDPADPGARSPRVDYRSTVGSYKSQRPVDPAPWGAQTERVAPAPKSGQ